MAKRTLYGTVIVTYRCNAHCNMCDCFKDPTRPEEEITLDDIRLLPEMAFTNITGGEPFIRKDIGDIVEALYKKSNRIVISTNGYFTDRILELCRRFPKVGIRISIEGLQQTNDTIRGIPDGFNRGYSTLKKLVEMGHPDVGFGMTVQDLNCEDLVPLYKISDELGMEFATATLHNSFYFRKTDNKIDDKYKVAQNFEALINELLHSHSPKKWFRAYFNHGLINYIYGNKRLLPCDMSKDAFFIDPFCDVIPCNGMAKKARKNINRALSLLGDYSQDKYNKVQEKENLIDKYEDKLGTYLMQLTGQEMSTVQMQQVSKFLHTISDFERLGDHAVNISKVANEISEKKITFSESAQKELSVLEAAVREIVDLTVDAFCEDDLELAAKIEPLRELIGILCNDLKNRHVTRLREGKCEFRQGFAFNDLLTNLERIAAHCSNVAVAMIETETSEFDTHEYLKSVRHMKDDAYLECFDSYARKYSIPPTKKEKKNK